MNDFERLSLEAWVSINPETWEVELIQDLIQSVKWDVWTFVSPSYSQLDIDLARQVTSNLWEKVICSILRWRRARTRTNKWFDIILPGWIQLEVKTGRIWNVTVIKSDQLGYMDKDCLFWFVFYRTTGNKAPSYFIAQSNWTDPRAYLKRNLQIESIFIFPHPAVVYYYNTSKLSERNIWKTWVNYKPLWCTNALKLFTENHWEFEQFEQEIIFWKHRIKVYSLWYKI